MGQQKAIRKSICLGFKTLEIAQKHADDFYCGNLSAFIASRVLEFDENIKREQARLFSQPEASSKPDTSLKRG